jgi:diadenosine tetraphosphate (Ap4A) HIT family hydrolase
MTNFILPKVLDTPNFTVTPCVDCDVPGYLIVQPHQTSVTLHGLDASVRESLGQILSRLETAVLTNTGAEHVYILRFSEGLSSVHFHVFPRSREIAELWQAEHPIEAGRDGVNGPLLFAWARRKFHVQAPCQLSEITLATAVKLRSELDKMRW